MYLSNKIKLPRTGRMNGLVALDDIKKDELILEFEKIFLEFPTRTSMQIDNGIHIDSTNPDALENFLNHSCQPNGYINFETLTYNALCDIFKGEELTFNYLTTEWDLSNKFICNCGYKNCFHEIYGFKYLTFNQKKELEPLLSPFLRKKLKE